MAGHKKKKSQSTNEVNLQNKGNVGENEKEVIETEEMLHSNESKQKKKRKVMNQVMVKPPKLVKKGGRRNPN